MFRLQYITRAAERLAARRALLPSALSQSALLVADALVERADERGHVLRGLRAEYVAEGVEPRTFSRGLSKLLKLGYVRKCPFCTNGVIVDFEHMRTDRDREIVRRAAQAKAANDGASQRKRSTSRRVGA